MPSEKSTKSREIASIIVDLLREQKGEEVDVSVEIAAFEGYDPREKACDPSLRDRVIKQVYALCPEAEEAAHGGTSLVLHWEAPSTETIENEFACGSRVAGAIQGVIRAGYRHGHQGYYPDGEFGQDADWAYGTGHEIAAIEHQLGIEDGAVFDAYREAHGEGLERYQEENPECSDADPEEWQEDECPESGEDP